MSTYIDTLDPQKVLEATDKLRAKHPEAIEQAHGDVRFALYLALLDRAMYRRVGLSYQDLADFNVRDAYDNGATPREAVQECLENDDTFSAFASEYGEDI